MTKQSGRKPVVLIVRDGWGRNPHPEQDRFNAIKMARTPHNQTLLRGYPWTLIHTSGQDVGLPEGTMGNSEVGHQNLGAGRIVDQDSGRISRAILQGDFFRNPALTQAVEKARKAGRYIHLMGLASDAGVHALLTHLYACVELCKKMGHDKVALHLFMDGRDTGPYSGKEFARKIDQRLGQIGLGRIVSVTGRYYAMDRDNRWDRVEKGYNMLTGRGEFAAGALHYDDHQQAIQDYYDQPTNTSQQGDEFITPRAIGADWKQTRVSPGDSVIFFNYRGDRPREISRAFVFPDELWAQVKPSPQGQRGFDRGAKLELFYVTLTAYDQELEPFVHVAFVKPPKMEATAGEYLSKLGLTQYRCAETEKYPHVTFFFNDYREEAFPGEHRQMAASPKVATYDLQPEMSAPAVRDLVLGRLAAADCEDFILVNFANGDMVGHTGKIEAAIKAIEIVDDCVGRIVQATLGRGGSLIVTADHGNAEQEWEPLTNNPHTAHTTYDVECIVVDPRFNDRASGDPERPSAGLRAGGNLADVMPTVLELMGLSTPAAMTGRSLLQNP